MKNFFISYTATDTAWADWIAWELDAIGSSVLMQKWDFSPGTNFAEAMHSAIKECERLILVLSSAALKSDFVTAEWAAFFAKDPSGKKKLLVPVRVEDCRPDGLLGQLVYADLFNLKEDQARSMLLRSLGLAGAPRHSRPLFPGTTASTGSLSGPTFPGASEYDLVGESVGILNSYYSASVGVPLPTIRRRAIGRIFAERHLQDLVKAEFDAGRVLSIMSIDVDGMSGINTKFGVDIGDAVVERLFHYCESIAERLLVGRMGDDTLFVLLSTESEHNVMKVASRIVKKIARADWGALAKDLYVRCSAGSATFNLVSEPAFDTLRRAIDGQLCARRLGGNRASPGPAYRSRDREKRKPKHPDMARYERQANLQRNRSTWTIS
jgi:diguanylate cyclase (GGDEF)-like protein